MEQKFRKTQSRFINTQLTITVFKNHLDKISKYLNYHQINQLKQVNRLCYYTLITMDVWSYIKFELAQTKMQYLEDDIQFQNQINQSQPSNKVLRNIRIHSLNKKIIQTEGSNKLIDMKKKKLIPQAPRFPSTYKNVIQPNQSTQQQKYMKTTQLGFKRLKRNKNQNSIQNFLEIPQMDVNNFQIKLNDNMSKNVEKARIIGQILGKWVQFQKKMLENNNEGNKEANQKFQIGGFWKQKQLLFKQYIQRMNGQKYQAIIKNLDHIIIIDDSLKKKHKAFIQNNKFIIQNGSKIKIVVQQYVKILKKINDLNNQQGIGFFQIIQQILQMYMSMQKQNKGILSMSNGAFIEMIQGILSKQLHHVGINIKILSINSQESQILLDIIYSVLQKFIRIIEQSCDVNKQFKQGLILNKLKSYKQITNNLIKIVKYFMKIKTQLKIKKQKKNIHQPTILQIQHFLDYYKNYQIQYEIYQQKNITKVQKQLLLFKKTVENLKNTIKQK